jgi:hypothetical protein
MPRDSGFGLLRHLIGMAKWAARCCFSPAAPLFSTAQWLRLPSSAVIQPAKRPRLWLFVAPGSNSPKNKNLTRSSRRFTQRLQRRGLWELLGPTNKPSLVSSSALREALAQPANLTVPSLHLCDLRVEVSFWCGHLAAVSLCAYSSPSIFAVPAHESAMPLAEGQGGSSACRTPKTRLTQV